jgi:hypothetical protein
MHTILKNAFAWHDEREMVAFYVFRKGNSMFYVFSEAQRCVPLRFACSVMFKQFIFQF